MKITAYNTFGTKESRVVISYEDHGSDEDAKRLARHRARDWNKNEVREDMRINFLVFDSQLTTV